MKTWLKVLIGVIAVIAVAGGIFVMTSDSDKEENKEKHNVEESDEKEKRPSKDDIDDANEAMDALMVSSFNAQFMPYCGTEIRGTSVKALVSISKANNININVLAGEIEEREIYTVVESYDKMGMINKITVMKDGIEINVGNQTEDKEKLENEGSSKDALLVATFNQQFMSYCGPNVKGILVKALISISKTNNVDINVSAYEINEKGNYTVLESYGKDGMINKITITEN